MILVAGGNSPSSSGTDPLYLASVWMPTAAIVALRLPAHRRGKRARA